MEEEEVERVREYRDVWARPEYRNAKFRALVFRAFASASHEVFCCPCCCQKS